MLLWLVAFFGVVVRRQRRSWCSAAISTFGGVETQSSYQAGLMFEQRSRQGRAPGGAHWQVDGKLVRDRAGEAVLDIRVRDAQGAPRRRADGGRARSPIPADARRDHVIQLSRAGAGAFRGADAAEPGQWELIIDLYRGDERVFRSRNRVTLQ